MSRKQLLCFCQLHRAPFTDRVVLQFAVVHVDYVGADTIQEVLGVGYQHKDPLEPRAPCNLLI